MTRESEPSVLGGLPHSRPHRRSQKREIRPEATPDATGATDRRTGATDGDTRTADRLTGATHGGPSGHSAPAEIVGTAVQAAAELAEIGLKAGAFALRIALSRLPRP